MTATVADIGMARAGIRIAIVSRTWGLARDQLEQLAPHAGTDAKVTRTNGAYAITYPSGGVTRFMSANHSPRGLTFDRVTIAADAVTDAVLTEYGPTVATTDGQILIGATDTR